MNSDFHLQNVNVVEDAARMLAHRLEAKAPHGVQAQLMNNYIEGTDQDPSYYEYVEGANTA